ncbi:LLM class flavin-dependent oxidoreductase, partial [Streptomyces sp. SID8499]|uniref:LLM class flavin-dependent oxidoreductase n=1 Tax=Streptomyces sp. SID8499 TaxID=2706106 RepID=UPI001EF26BD4
MTARPPRRMHLAVYAPGAAAPAAGAPHRTPPGARTGFAALEDLARTAERGLFDFLLLAEGRRGEGRCGTDGIRRPEPVSVLGALAGVTERLGLAATVDTAFDEPYELARRLATLDHLSGGRAAWNASGSALTGAFTDEGAGRGGHPDRADRCARAAEFVATARELWDSWTPEGGPRPFAHRGRHFDIAGEFTVPRPPQGHPVVLQAGDSDEERESAAATADIVLTRPRTLRDAQEFYADLKQRLARHGRAPGELRILQAARVVVGDSETEALKRAAALRDAVRAAAVPQLRAAGRSYAPEAPPPAGPVPAPALARRRVETGPPEPQPLTQEPPALVEHLTIPPADRAPIPAEPAPVLVEPAPVPADRAPASAEPAPALAEPAPVLAEPAPVPADRAPALTDPAPAPADPTPAPADCSMTPAEPVPIPARAAAPGAAGPVGAATVGRAAAYPGGAVPGTDGTSAAGKAGAGAVGGGAIGRTVTAGGGTAASGGGRRTAEDTGGA